MPIMSGYEATVQIKNHISRMGLNNVPVIALTANIHKEDQEKCKVSGMDDFYAKPVRINSMQEILDKWVLGKARH